MLTANSVMAYDNPTPYVNKRMSGGIGNVTVYIDSSQTPKATYWQALIKNAIHNWMYTGYGANDFYATYVSSNNGSKMDFHAKYPSFWTDQNRPEPYAECRHYSTSDQLVNPESHDWYYAIIYLNHTALSDDTVSNDTATGIFAHEIGHAFGMKHNVWNPNSIMCTLSPLEIGASPRAVNTVQKVDNDALNEMY